MISSKKGPSKKVLSRNVRNISLGRGILVWLSLIVLPCACPAVPQSQPPRVVQPGKSGLPDPPGTGASAGDPYDQSLSGSISGTVVDRTGAVVAGARVLLTREDQSLNQEVLSGNNGQFSFVNIAAGPFKVAVTSAGFETQASSGILHSGETYIVPPIALVLRPLSLKCESDFRGPSSGRAGPG